MEYVDKAKTWAKANKSLSLFGAFVVIGVLANLMGLGS